MNQAILLDFGSTFTKMAIVDVPEKAISYTFKVPSTVRTDARICLEQCFAYAKKQLGAKAFRAAPKLASSSAAGGLRMAVLGLSQTLSITAARNASFGAGAKILGTFIGKLEPSAIDALQALDIEILLFTGGYEGGNTSTLAHNARMLAASNITAPIIFAGNSQMANTVRLILQQTNKTCFIVPNIIPNVQMINASPTEELIRHVFMTSIINMKGLRTIQRAFDAPLIPTPAAVLEAGKLLSCGTSSQQGLGPLAIIDVGGATTDIHSYVEQSSHEGARLAGSPEPFAKRTVEGDLGMRESSQCLAQEVGWVSMANNLQMPVDALQKAISTRFTCRDYLPHSLLEHTIDQEIAASAVHLSARRHAGWIQSIPEGCNCKYLQYGKNISNVTTIIGTGGPIINSSNPQYILSKICALHSESHILLPIKATYCIDKHYILFSAGLLLTLHKDVALSVMKESITYI